MSVTDKDIAATAEWIHKFNQSGDSLQIQPWIEKFFAPDAEVRQPGQLPVCGRDEIIHTMKAQLAFIGSIKHTVRRIDVLPDRVYQEALVEWTVKGDPEARVITAEGLGVFDKDLGSEHARGFTVYADFSALTKRIAEVHNMSV